MKKLFIVSVLLFAIVVSVNAQENTELSNELRIYVCITNNNTAEGLIEFYITEPIGLMFSKSADIVVYSSAGSDVVADVIHITSDTFSGSYKRTGDVVIGAHATANIPLHENCQAAYPDQLTDLNRTILLPVSPDQALTIHRLENEIDYNDAEKTLFIGAVGLYFLDPTTKLPNLQLLRVSDGRNDVVSIRFPDIVAEAQIYAIAVTRTSYTSTISGLETQSKFMDDRDLFVARLSNTGEKLINTIMSPGNFRFYAGYGERLNYAPNDLLNISRLSSFSSRAFAVGDNIIPIDCTQSVPYFRLDDYTHYVYFSDERTPVVGDIRCDKPIIIEEVREDGILIVEGGFAIAAWLVRPESE